MIWLCLAMAAISAPDDDASLRVVTYNIHHAEGADRKLNLDRIASVIKSLHPDVVCLQEVDNGLARTGRANMPEALGKLLDMTGVFGPNYELEGGRYGNATFTRLPILSSENTPLPTPSGQEPRGCLRTTLRTSGRTVDVFNVHFGLTPEQQKEQASAVLALLGPGPSIVAGDLNATPDSPVLEILSGRLRDTLATAGTKTPSRIDYVLVTAELDVLSSRVVSAPPAELASDHLPCAADVRLGSAPRGAEAQGVLDADDKRVDQALGE